MSKAALSTSSSRVGQAPTEAPDSLWHLLARLTDGHRRFRLGRSDAGAPNPFWRFRQEGDCSRRGLLGAGGLLALAGCGFQPMYGPASGGAGMPLDFRRELAAIRLEYIGERTGVLVTRALERRFTDAAGGEVVPPKYALELGVTYGAEVLGYRRDGAISRLRFTATSSWVLSRRGNPPEEIKRGVVRTIDAFNVPDFQFFTAEVSSDAMQRRLLDEIVEQVFLNVAANLRGWLRDSQG